MKAAAPALLPLLRSQAQGEMLALLFLHPGDEFSLSDVARITGSSLTTIHAEASRMVKAGLVRDRRLGNVRLVSADTDNPLAAPLLALLMASYGPSTILGQELAAIPGIDHAYLHGAWAERHAGRQGPPPEGLELLIVGTVPEDVLSSAVARAGAVLLRPIQTKQVTPTAWSAAQEGEPTSSWLAAVASGPLVPVDLTPRERAGSQNPRRVVDPPEELPGVTSTPAPGGQLPPEGPEEVLPTQSEPATSTHRPTCPLLARLPVIGEQLQRWDLPQLPAPALPDVLTRVATGVAEVATLKWLPWHSLPIHVHLGPCSPESTGN